MPHCCGQEFWYLIGSVCIGQLSSLSTDDPKENFGTLLKNGIYSERSTLEVPVNTWSVNRCTLKNNHFWLVALLRNGLTHTYSAPKIPQSNYLIQLEETVDEEDDNEKLDPPASKDVRYWSDYNHIYFLPESIHPLSISRPQSNGEDQEVRWTEGCELFENYERVSIIVTQNVLRPFGLINDATGEWFNGHLSSPLNRGLRLFTSQWTVRGLLSLELIPNL